VKLHANDALVYGWETGVEEALNNGLKNIFRSYYSTQHTKLSNALGDSQQEHLRLLQSDPAIVTDVRYMERYNRNQKTMSDKIAEYATKLESIKKL
jgi:hypothetical protein